MIRFVLRFLGLLLLACGFAALIVDGTRSLAAGSLTVTSMGEALTATMPARLAGLAAATRAVHPLLWDPIAVTALRVPIWLLAGLFGGLLFAITARRRAPIGWSSR